MSVNAPLDDGRPVVPLPAGGPPPAVLIGACLAVGLGLFALLEGRRQHAAHPPPPPVQPVSMEYASSPPPLDIPPAVSAAPAAAEGAAPTKPSGKPDIRVIRPDPDPQPATPPGDPPAQIPALSPPAHLQEPALVIDLTEADGDPAKGAEAAHATVMRHKAMIVPEGVVIPAVLETPINSTAPGPVRAITSRDISGFDGSRVLIPRGSRLLGEYQANVQAGQTRVLVTWTSLVRPDGVSVRLGSPASDPKGGIGVPGAVNNHILARFGSAVLQSALAVGVNLAYRPAAGAVILGAPVQAASSAGPLFPDAQAGPTITAKEGADIGVFVARDLDFSGTLPR